MFFRQGTDSEKRAAARPRGSNDAQLKELRAKARRRLVGALALVLAAVIVVPWFFQEPMTGDTHAPVVVPAAPPGLPAAGGSSGPAGAAANPQAQTPANGAQGAVQPADSSPTTAPGAPAPAPAPAPSPSGSESATIRSPAVRDELDAAVASVTKPPEQSAPTQAKPAESPRPAESSRSTESSRPSESAKPAKKPVERTDDGSVALALLEGKTPPKASAPAKASGQGRYFLQVASYSTEQDAQSRRDSLRQAGVTDAYVERGQASGRTVYRLRVGPFGSHEAAQAAQARLRALGYQNGLISAN
ncbi:DedD protein OS=Castellaniella defragrans OX=75697 GN=HNR28_002379 PE=4 SV=1 [Castellaniella defragrans]